MASADVFVGASAKDALSVSDVSRMANDAIVFALVNPDPEIALEDAKRHVRVMATGRSDFSTQINNVLCYSVVTGGMLGCGATEQPSRGQRVAVDGIVTLDGDHLQAGRIVYITDQGAGKVKAAAAIVHGYYNFTVENGPLAGKARVEIYPKEIELEQFEEARGEDRNRSVDIVAVKIPVRYNLRSELSADVQHDAESNLFHFDLLSK